MLARLLSFTDHYKIAQSLYEDAAIHARSPAFYADMGVPDSVDGRFDMIALHVVMIIHALNAVKGDKRAKKLSQALFDRMFLDMEQSLREMGIGDLSVPKHMTRMMNGFNGRLQSYNQAFEGALDGEGAGALSEVLVRNIYGGEAADEHVAKLGLYVMQAIQDLQSYSTDKIIDGSIIYPTL